MGVLLSRIPPAPALAFCPRLGPHGLPLQPEGAALPPQGLGRAGHMSGHGGDSVGAVREQDLPAGDPSHPKGPVGRLAAVGTIWCLENTC